MQISGFGFRKTVPAAPHSQSTKTPERRLGAENATLTWPAGKDDDKHPWFERAEQLKGVLARMEASRPDIAAERRARAKQRVDSIRQQLEALRLMTASNPKAVARQAARLARELASAVREYAAAGGTDASGMSVSRPTPTQPATTAARSENQQTIANATVAATDIDLSEIAAGDVAIETYGTSAEQVSANTPEAEDAPLAEPQHEVGQNDPQPAHATSLAERARNNAAAKQEDEEFKDLVRRVVSALRSVMRQAISNMSSDEGTSVRQETLQAEKELAEAEQRLSSMMPSSAA